MTSILILLGIVLLFQMLECSFKALLLISKLGKNNSQQTQNDIYVKKKDIQTQSFVVYHHDNVRMCPLHQSSRVIQQEQEHWFTMATFKGTFSSYMKSII